MISAVLRKSTDPGLALMAKVDLQAYQSVNLIDAYGCGRKFKRFSGLSPICYLHNLGYIDQAF
jgi:hypothetical protein